MSSFWKDINSYTQSQKRALILIWCATAGIIAYGMARRAFPEPPSAPPELDTILTRMARHLPDRDAIPTELTATFDPNNATADEMCEIGIPSFVASNIAKLRAAGKTYRRPGDLRRVYGMSDTLFAVIEPYIDIESDDDQDRQQRRRDNRRRGRGNDRDDDRDDDRDAPISITAAFDPNTASVEQMVAAGLPQRIAANIEKYRSSGGKFDNAEALLRLYTVDSAAYEQIKGHVAIERTADTPIAVQAAELNTSSAKEIALAADIEISLAFKITNYRDKLGGFLRHEQLAEIPQIGDSLLPLLRERTWLDSMQINRLKINQAEYADILRHPYIGKESVSKLTRYRKFVKQIKGPEELSKNKILQPDELSRILPYLDFSVE